MRCTAEVAHFAHQSGKRGVAGKISIIEDSICPFDHHSTLHHGQRKDSIIVEVREARMAAGGMFMFV